MAVRHRRPLPPLSARRRRAPRARATLAALVGALVAVATPGEVRAEDQQLIGSVSVDTTEGRFFVDLEEDDPVVREFARAFASLVRDRVFFHESDKRIGCTADPENCFDCQCDFGVGEPDDCLGQPVGRCVGDPNERSCTSSGFRVNDLLAPSRVLHAGLFELDSANALQETTEPLDVSNPMQAGIFQNDPLTVAFVRDGTGTLTREWVIHLADNSDLEYAPGLTFDDADNRGANAYFVIGRVSDTTGVIERLAELPTIDARCNASLAGAPASIRQDLEQLPFFGSDDDEPVLIETCAPDDLDCRMPLCITPADNELSCEEPLCYSISELPEEEQVGGIVYACDFPEQPSFPLVTRVAPAGLTLIANGLAPPEPNNVIDFPNNPQLTVDVRDEGCIVDPDDPPGPCTNPGDPTFVELRSGGSVSTLRVSDLSRLTVLGGELGVALELRDTARARLQGGSVTAATTELSSDLALDGGSLGSLATGDDSTARIAGGDVADIDALGDSLVRVVGRDFTVDAASVGFGPLVAASGLLAGTLLSGEPLSATFDQGGPVETGVIHLLSEDDLEPTRDFVSVGLASNPADPDTGLGAVDRAYRIGQRPVSNADYAAFLNAVARSDPNSLWDARMASDARGGIRRTGAAGNYRYATIPGRADWPVVFVSRFDAMRFANWLHNGGPEGDAGSTEQGSYAFVGGVLQGGREPGARFVIPSLDEWYKAAYYDPATGSYRDYPTGSDTLPVATSPTRDLGNQVNAGSAPGSLGGLSDAGAYRFSASAFGTLDQGGNTLDWLEDSLALRGGHWDLTVDRTGRTALPVSVSGPEAQESFVGFRVPEPGAGLLAAAAAATLAALRRRRPVRWHEDPGCAARARISTRA